VEGGAGLDFSGEKDGSKGQEEVPEGGGEGIVPPMAVRGGEEECGDGVEGEGAADADADADADEDASETAPHPLLAPLTQPFIEAMVGLLMGSQPRDLRRQAQALCEACVDAALRGEVVAAMKMLESGRSARNG
jgi:hypothetical protein